MNDSVSSAVTDSGISGLREQESEHVPLCESIAQRGVNLYAIEYHHRCKILSPVDVQSANRKKAILIGAISDACIRSNRELDEFRQVLAYRRVNRSAAWCADAIGACAKDQRWSVLRFGYCDDVREQPNIVRKRVIFDADGNAWVQAIGQRGSQSSSRNLIAERTYTVCPLVWRFICRPAHGAAFTWS